MCDTSRGIRGRLKSSHRTSVSAVLIWGNNWQGTPCLTYTSRPKFTILWGDVEEILLLNKFFSDCRYMPQLRRYSPTKSWDGVQTAIFASFLCPVFSASHMQHISVLHSKFALRPHHVWKYGRRPISDCWDKARKKKKEETGWTYIWSALLHMATINEWRRKLKAVVLAVGCIYEPHIFSHVVATSSAECNCCSPPRSSLKC